MSAKILASLFAVALTASTHLAAAQQPAKVSRIGFLSGRAEPSPANPDPTADAFRQGLRYLGYVDEKNIFVDYRYAAGMQDRWQSLVAELLQLRIDILGSPVGAAVLAAKQASKTIPIVMMITGDPVATGLIDSLARPGGNITGLYRLTQDLSGKRLELLKEVVPQISRVGILWDPTGRASPKDYEVSARALKMRLQSLEVRGPNPDLEGVFQAAILSNEC